MRKMRKITISLLPIKKYKDFKELLLNFFLFMINGFYKIVQPNFLVK